MAKKNHSPAKECADEVLNYLKKNEVKNLTFRQILKKKGDLLDTPYGVRRAGSRIFKGNAQKYMTKNGRTPGYSNNPEK